VSQSGVLSVVTGGGPVIETLTGNSGGPVGPDGAFNINVVGNNSSGINIVGNPGTNTLTVTAFQSTTSQEGTVTLATNAQAIAGTNTANAITPSNLTAKLGTQTAHSLAVFEGSTAALTALGAATNGQLPIGSTGADPVLANITSSGGTITITNGAGTINLDVTAGTGVVETLTGNSGGALSPTAGNINTLGTGSITIAGAGSTLTSQLTGLTNHNVLVGAGTATITKVAPSATSGVPLISQGAAADPIFGTAVVAGGGTGQTTLTNHGVLVGATTAAITQLSVGSNGQVLIGATAADPAFATLTSSDSSISFTTGANTLSLQVAGGSSVIKTITGNTGGAESPSSGNFNILGTGSITVAGTANTETVQLTGITNHAIQIGAGTATLTQLGAGTTGQILQTNTTADPTWSTATYPSTTTVSQILYSSSTNVVAGLSTANNGVLITSNTGVPSILAAGTTGQILTATTGAPPSWASPATSGTVTSVSVATANGFAGTVANATTTPAITLTTSQTGLLSGNGTAITGTAITQYNVLTAGASNAPNNVAPSATSGVPLISQGSSAQPIFGTAVVAGGGTGATTLTGYVYGNGTSAMTASATIPTTAILGATTGTTPAAGYLGETIRGYNGSGVSLSTTVIGNITSIALTAGVWDVSCVAYIVFSVTATVVSLGIGTANNSFLGIGGDNLVQFALTTSLFSPSIPSFRVNISSPATYYLNSQNTFATGTCTAYGRISATRVG